jgi:hypothetical protein
MLVDFENIGDDARLWIYQIDKNLTISEEEKLLSKTSEFLVNWTAHGSNLKAAVSIVAHRMLIIAADETFAGASGCSIDSKMAFLREIQMEMGIDLFSRNKLFYLENDILKIEDLNEFKNKLAQGEISDETFIYNTTIHKKGQMKDAFLIPVKNSWLMRLIEI